MNISHDNTINRPESMTMWLIMLARLGRVLFSLAILGIGLETLICTYLSSHSPRPPHVVIPVIPWVPAVPGLAYCVGAIFILSGIGFLFERTLVASSFTLGLVMLVCGLAFDVPRHPDLMSAPWRTNVLEPIVIGSLAWLAPAAGAVPRWLCRTSCYLLAFALIVFGIGHFQILASIAAMVPGWIPWHVFWTVFFGAGFVVAGISFAARLYVWWAALGLGLMFALWEVTIHLPLLLASPDADKWSDVFIVAALSGGFWMIARNLRDKKDSSLGQIRIRA